MNDVNRIREELVALDPLPPDAEGDWEDVLERVVRPRHRRRPVLVGGAIATVVAVIAVLLLLPTGSGGPGPAAAAALNRLAHLVAAQSLTPGSGQYLYVDSKNDYGAFSGDCETRAIRHRQIWISPDGSGLIRETDGPEQFTSAADRTACLNTNPNMQLQSGGTTNDWFAPRCLSLRPGNFDWSTLSDDPGTLLQELRTLDGGPTTPAEDFVHIGDFLRETDAPPAVRATLYRAAALIPGIQLLGTVRDHDGRPGLGIAYTYPPEDPSHPGPTSELIFNQQTGELSGEQQTGSGGYWAVYLNDEVVNNLPSTPPEPLTPPCDSRGGGYGHQLPGGSITNGAPRTSP